ncbi:MAG TPA: sialidase family protein [Acidimicrobiales bacterium]|jgi:hypothetical protein|nr:sialidase family protein [Acidimicrobiales bacterium]
MALLTRPPAPAPDVELLIEEARHLRRRRWTIGVIAVVVVVASSIVALTLTVGGSGGHRRSGGVRTPPPAASTAALGQELTSSSLGVGTTVVAGSMLSATTGFAVAGSPISGTGYIVSTSDAGEHWIIRGVTPFSMRRYFFVPAVGFLSPSLGYVESGLTQAVYVTRDGGRSWRPLVVPGNQPAFLAGSSWLPAPSFAVVGRSLVLLGQRCGRLRCRPLLATFALGRARAARVLTPPAVPLWYGTPLFVTSPSPGVLTFTEGSWWHHRAALYVSHTGGATWARASSPCRGRTQASPVTVVRGGSWLTSCFLGEGMTQGLSEMWRSNDEGVTWNEVAVGNMGNAVHTFGGLPDSAAALSSSNDGRLVWGLLGFAPGGVMVSANAGNSWRYLHQSTGQSWETIAPAGPHGAVAFTPGASLWTSDGTRFVARRLPSARRG